MIQKNTFVSFILSIGCFAILIVFCDSKNFAEIKGTPIYTLLSFVGILGVYLLSLTIEKHKEWKHLNSVLEHYGNYSLQYYLNHLLIMLPCFYTISFFKLGNWLSLILIFILALLISYIMLFIEKKYKLLSYISGLKV